jgi:hypothetical protein
LGIVADLTHLMSALNVSHLMNVSIESIGNLTEVFANNSAITDLLNELTLAINASEISHNSTAPPSTIAQFLRGNETLVIGNRVCGIGSM